MEHSVYEYRIEYKRFLLKIVMDSIDIIDDAMDVDEATASKTEDRESEKELCYKYQ